MLGADDNFRWVAVEGVITFAGGDGAVGLLEVMDGSSSAQINVGRCVMRPPFKSALYPGAS